jgi:SAM-dependent methyltransferase
MPNKLLSKLSLIKNQARRINALEAERALLREKLTAAESLLAACDCLPVPPESLRVRVGGWEDADHFLGVGRKIFWDLKRLLKGVGRGFESFGSVMDFGCGCGRVIRHLSPAPGQAIVGVDIDPEAIGWCAGHLGRIAEFRTCGHLPPLPFPDQTFDFVYCISVFTHLPEEMQSRWLEELRRVIRKRGVLIASVHGEGLLPAGDPEIAGRFKREGFIYVKGGGTEGLPEFYQSTYHAPAYIERTWGRFFDVKNIQPRAINNHQDAVVCLRR